MILFNSEGLRPGWSLLLYLFLVGLISVMLALLVKPGGHALTASNLARSEMIGCIAFLAAALIMARVESRPFASYGFARAGFLPQLLSGLVAGLVFLCALVGVLSLTHHLIFEGPLLRRDGALPRGLAWLLVFALVALQEEFSTRGYLQVTLARAIAGLTRTLAPAFRHAEAFAFWLAALILSFGVFMGLHLANAGETVIGIFAVGLAGLTFVFSLWRTGSLWWAIGFHTTWDWAQSFLFGVPDSGTTVANRLLASHPAGARWLSGGTAGPEGSLFVLPTFLLVCLTVHLLYPRAGAVQGQGKAEDASHEHLTES